MFILSSVFRFRRYVISCAFIFFCHFYFVIFFMSFLSYCHVFYLVIVIVIVVAVAVVVVVAVYLGAVSMMTT